MDLDMVAKYYSNLLAVSWIEAQLDQIICSAF